MRFTCMRVAGLTLITGMASPLSLSAPHHGQMAPILAVVSGRQA